MRFSSASSNGIDSGGGFAAIHALRPTLFLSEIRLCFSDETPAISLERAGAATAAPTMARRKRRRVVICAFRCNPENGSETAPPVPIRRGRAPADSGWAAVRRQRGHYPMTPHPTLLSGQRAGHGRAAFPWLLRRSGGLQVPRLATRERGVYSWFPLVFTT